MWSLLFVLVLGKGLAVHIDVVAPEPMLSLDLGCNVFGPGIPIGGAGNFDRTLYTGTRTGILVSKNDLPNQETKLGTVIISPTSYDFKGGASTFPTIGLRDTYSPACSLAVPREYNVEASCSNTSVWGSPGSWIAIDNQSTVNPVRYFAYRNEYLDRNNSNQLVIRRLPPNLSDGSLATTDATIAAGNPLYELRCENFLDFEVFPTSMAHPRQPVAVEPTKPHLLNPVPNPAHSSCTIGVVMAGGIGEVQIFNISSGMILASRIIASPKDSSVSFALSSFQRGIYGYRLLVNKVPIDTKILTVE